MTLTVQRSIWGAIIRPTKTGKIRTITLTQGACAAIRAHMAELPDPNGWLFPGQRRDDVDRHFARNDRVAAALDAYPAGSARQSGVGVSSP